MSIHPSFKTDASFRKRATLICIMDVLTMVLSFSAALWLKFDFRFSAIPAEFKSALLSTLPGWCLISILVFAIFGLYNSVWSFAGADEVFRIVAAYCVLGLMEILLYQLNPDMLPLSFYIIGLILSFMATVCIRFSYRFLRQIRAQLTRLEHKNPQENVMLIGAGEAGKILLTEFQSSAYIRSNVVCIIDDNPAKLHKRLNGVPIVGDRFMIPEAVTKYAVNRIIYAIPSSSAKTRRDVLAICSRTGCPVQVLPGIFQLVNGEVSVSKLRQVDAQDLLGRDPIRVRLEEILDYIAGKTVLITGGGGSIGSELCRQIARANPAKLIVLDIYENNAYDIQQELQRMFPRLNLVTLIGSVRNQARIEQILQTHKPELVFHAAAHKHVPLMESSPNEAIKNNVFGTWNMARAAAKYGVRRFVLISTDKAVNPTNIMGASKRLCEMIVQMMNRQSNTEFVAVRFGNVLGSNGSVIPLFMKQIAAGGPVTVTHPDIIRYFMTIPEAVSLVLQAGFYAKGGEIFVLDMGEPVRIDDMARNLIRLSGFEPDVDIMVKYTGLRPGEKLYEELLMEEEGLQDTANRLIHIGKPIEMDDALFQTQLARLEQACLAESPHIRELVAQMVSTYHPSVPV